MQPSGNLQRDREVTSVVVTRERRVTQYSRDVNDRTDKSGVLIPRLRGA